jgi:hypothetical protein
MSADGAPHPRAPCSREGAKTMDPAIELATLVVSYVWPLRSLFPEAKTVFDLTVRLPQLDGHVGRDFALIERLADLSSRTADETWSGTDPGTPMGHAADDLDQRPTPVSPAASIGASRPCGSNGTRLFSGSLASAFVAPDDQAHFGDFRGALAIERSAVRSSASRKTSQRLRPRVPCLGSRICSWPIPASVSCSLQPGGV